MGGISIGPIFWALAALGGAAALAYGLHFLKRPPSLVRALIKTLFMGAAAAALISAHAPFPLIVAIICSALGDFFLAFKAKWTLPLGILAFLLAQLVYVVMFGAIWFFSGDNAPLWPRYAAMVGIGVFLVSFLIWFWRTPEFKRAPISGGLTVAALVALGVSLPILIVATLMVVNGEADSRPPLTAFAPLAGFVLATIALAIWRRKLGAVPLAAMIYAGAICAMAITAMWLPWIGWPAMIGAISFLTSDLVLAGELFRLPADAPARRWTAPVVWWTYVAAQVLIITGVITVVLAR
ncbi:MAG: lysoplasmalogenase family protein [Alphaproteobacteria bacterium]|nr:lysoplasmalogenase family protein [Alphaproteobacteria bacterium]